MSHSRRIVAVLIAGLLALSVPGALGQAEHEAKLHDDRSPGQRTLDAMRLPEGFSASLFAEEPLLENPVAFCFDEIGQVYVAETFRQELGVEDNRAQPYWLLDDISNQTVSDRLAMYRKWADKRERGMDHYTDFEDRIRILRDTDGDGVADLSRVFADGFNDALDGTGAGVIARDGVIYYTNIPHLWMLPDRDRDGVADERVSLHDGYGVRIALRGHDMHGLVWGPDGRLYYSIGDRGYHIETDDGRVLHSPGAGAVFRCEPDGSELEVVHYGLRNPQELAFDQYGNLFTGDNNSDAGDRARLVYIVDGGETGWNMNYQTLEGANVRGPWVQERIWEPRHADQPAWILPPIENITSGPSGLTYYPGVGLPGRFDDHFFLCDFRGGASASSVVAFSVEPDGAGFALANQEVFAANVLATDVEFGYDGRLYIADWVEGWVGEGVGRLYAIEHDAASDDAAVSEVTRIFREGFAGRSSPDLETLLHHPDMRVRLRAQFELADRGGESVERFHRLSRSKDAGLARLHAIWGLGIVARRQDHPDAASGLVGLLEDQDAEIRAQAARVLGDVGYIDAAESIRYLLTDESERVQYFAAMALGELAYAAAIDDLISLAWQNDDRDLYLRHVAVMALWRMNDLDTILEYADDPSSAVRRVIVLVLRRAADSRIAGFLSDEDESIVTEAARAINDLPIPEAMSDLARLIHADEPAEPAEASPPPARYRFQREFFRNASAAASPSDASSTHGSNGTGADALENHPVFSREPDESDATTIAEGRTNFDDNYATRIKATIRPPMSGAFTFYLKSDDASTLFLAEAERPGTRRRIAWIDDWVGADAWTQVDSQISNPIHLDADRVYELEVFHLEGGGQDHVAVGWRLPDGSVERPIGAGPEVEGNLPLLRRAINANLRLGGAEHAAALAEFARDHRRPLSMRHEALAALADWVDPSPRDRVIGSYRPVDPDARDQAAAARILERALPGLIDHTPPTISAAARDLAVQYEITLDPKASLTAVADRSLSTGERVSALNQLARDQSELLESALEVAMASSEPALRIRARDLLVTRVDEDAAAAIYRSAWSTGELDERRAALDGLATIGGPHAAALVFDALRGIDDDSIDPALELDVLEVAAAMDDLEVSNRLAALTEAWDEGGPLTSYRMTLTGGDAERGREVFRLGTSASCLRCHTVDGVGGEAGPDLSDVGRRLSAESILESLVTPNATLAEGYEPPSAMPPATDALTKRQMRDLIAYLLTLQ